MPSTHAMRGTGSLVLVDGEAGVGKTALLRSFSRFASTRKSGRSWGSCDPLFTPRPLGPFLDVAETVGGDALVDRPKRRKTVRRAANLVRSLASPSPRRRFSSSTTCTGRTRRASTCCVCSHARIESLPRRPRRELPEPRGRACTPVATRHRGARVWPRAMHRVHVEPLSRDAVAVLGRAVRRRLQRAVSEDRGKPPLRHRSARRGGERDP